MYKFTRKHNKIILIVVCVFLLPFVGFSFWPLMRQFGARRQRERVAGTFELPRGVVHELKLIDWQLVKSRLERAMGTGLLPLRGPLTEDDVWAHITQVEEARLLGIRVSDEEVRDYIAAALRRLSRYLRRPQSFADYRRYVEARRLTVKEFEQTLREVMLRLELARFYASLQPVRFENLYRQFQQQHRRLTVKLVRFDIQARRRKLRPVDFPLKGRLEKFYADPRYQGLLMSKEELVEPRRFEDVEVFYARYRDFEPKKHAAELQGVAVSEQELREEYTRWREEVFKVPPEGEKTPAPKSDGKSRGDGQAAQRNAQGKKEAGEKPEAGASPAQGKARPQGRPPGGGKSKPAEKAPQKEEPRYRPYEEVKEELGRRVLLQKLALRLLRTAQDAAAAKGKEPADLKGLAARFGFRYERLQNLTHDGLKEKAPFVATTADERFAAHVDALRPGAWSESPVAVAQGVFFVRLVADRPPRLKPLKEVVDRVREIAMDEAAREEAEQAARAFYDGLEEAVKQALAPRLEQEVYRPLEEEMRRELAAEAKRRRESGEPPLTAAEKEKIRARYEERKKSRAGPLLERALQEELGRHFEAQARARGLEVVEVSFYPHPRAPFPIDPEARRREEAADPVKGFLRYSPTVRLLTRPGQVTRPVTDDYRAVYVLKVAAVTPARWERLDPLTYRYLVQQVRRGYQEARAAGADRLGYRQFEPRLHLKTDLRYRPEEEAPPSPSPQD